MDCNICSNKTERFFEAQVLKKYKVQYYFCPACEYVQTEKPYWLDEAYSESLNLNDTGLVSRNIMLSKIVALMLLMRFNLQAQYLDYGGGVGMFSRLMRDIGYDFKTLDPYTKNTLARGFTYSSGQIELVTSFECFEHFDDPIANINKILKYSRNILFSTELLPRPIPRANEWWYYGPIHGQHISFYSKKTIKTLARKFGLNSSSFKNIHLLTPKKISDFELAAAYIMGRMNLHKITALFLKSKTKTDSLSVIG